MTSHASVNLMLALEAAFDVEFPDAMLKRSVFQSVASITEALAVAGRAGGMSVAIDRDQAFLAAIRRIADEVAAPNADDVDRQARFPMEAIDALREERALSALIPDEFGGGGVSFEAIAARVLRARSPVRRDRHGLRDAPDPDRVRRAPSRRRAVVRGLSSGRRERAATRRVGHVGGRDRR